MGSGGGVDFAGMIEDRVGINLGGESQADRALNEQRRATGEANAIAKGTYDQQRADAAPWRDAGVNALKGLDGNADFQKDFTMADFQADPGYQFRMNEGLKAVQGSAAARGSVQSGATLKALTRFGQDTASGEYQNAYNRFNADRDRRYNRLSNLAGMGQTSNSQVMQAGQHYGDTVGGNTLNLGNAAASKYIGDANRMNQFMDRGEDMMMKAGGMMFSDSRMKENIREVSREDLKELQKVCKPYIFNYVNKEHGRGDWVGVMAQDIEKSKLGKTVVYEDEFGRKAVDYKKLLSLFVASQGEV